MTLLNSKFTLQYWICLPMPFCTWPKISAITPALKAKEQQLRRLETMAGFNKGKYTSLINLVYGCGYINKTSFHFFWIACKETDTFSYTIGNNKRKITTKTVNSLEIQNSRRIIILTLGKLFKIMNSFESISENNLFLKHRKAKRTPIKKEKNIPVKTLINV